MKVKIKSVVPDIGTADFICLLGKFCFVNAPGVRVLLRTLSTQSFINGDWYSFFSCLPNLSVSIEVYKLEAKISFSSILRPELDKRSVSANLVTSGRTLDFDAAEMIAADSFRKPSSLA